MTNRVLEGYHLLLLLNLSPRGNNAEIIISQPVCLHATATSTISFAILSGSSSDLKSFVPMCKMMVSGFSSSVDLTLVEICFVVAPGNDLTDTFSFVNDFDSCQPLTFLTIESPNITTALFFILDIELLCFL